MPIVYRDTSSTTEPKWYYHNVEYRTVADVSLVASAFKPKDLLLGKEGIIRAVISIKGNHTLQERAVPNSIINDVFRNGERCCSRCKKVKPVSKFRAGISERTNNKTRRCAKCRRNHTLLQRGLSGAKGSMNKFYLDRKKEDIKKFGCQGDPDCPFNKYLDEFSYDCFEYNHIDDTTKRRELSAIAWFTAARAERLGLKDRFELWESERENCELLCISHHKAHTKALRLKNRKRAHADLE